MKSSSKPSSETTLRCRLASAWLRASVEGGSFNRSAMAVVRTSDRPTTGMA